MKDMGNIKLWLWVFFLMIIVANGCLDEERSALLELQADMMSSNGGTLYVWAGYNESGFVDYCSWPGVKCSLATGRVIKLDLIQATYGSMDGWNFNASLFLPFKSLQVLHLSAYSITGGTKIEGIDKLSHLTNLKVLDLQYNLVHPNVLSSLCWISSLEVLKLSGFTWWKNYNVHIGEGSAKCPGLSNLRVLLLEGYRINDISILSALGLGTHIGLKKLEKLYLSDNSFNSSIFSSLKDLPSLTHLDLSYNEIDGKIEMSDIVALSNLKFMNLQGNKFESFVTTKGSKRMSSMRKLELGGFNSNSTNILQSLKSFSSLHSLSYRDSNLTAPTITYALTNLSTLEHLYLEGSSLNENFLSSIGQMTSLKVLSLAFGGNYGTLPNHGWCELKNIQELAFTNNNFEGTLPSCLGNLTSVKWLGLQGNNFTGNIDLHPFWRRLTPLEFLDISYNQFEVPLSFKQFANHSKLTYLDVGHNTITTYTEFQNWIPNFQLQLFAIHGCINLQKLPSFLHYQYDLRILAIDGNQLPGNFPTWLLENNTRLGALYARDNAFIGPLELPSSLPRLHTIDVSNNTLNGHIPTNFSSAFPKINRLNMSQNLIEGPIPSGVSGISLRIVDLSHNFLSGGVPSDLTSSPYLLYLQLSNNRLKGQIFSKNFRSSTLSFLYVNGNNFEGPLPSNIFFRDFIVLDASNNNFSGEIPRWIRDNSNLLQLDLSKNHFEGSIPVEICKLKSIKVLAMSENRLSGIIPSCVSGLPLDHIHLDNNKLGGGLEYLSNISSLITLDLGNNSFTGSIPHTIGSLSNLNFLLLNHNQLEGNIPAQICLLNELSIMDLSFNKIYGSLLPCLGNLIQAKRDGKIRTLIYASFPKEAWLNFLTWKISTMHYHNRYSMGESNFGMMDVETQVQFSTKRNTYTYKGSILKYMSGIDLSSNRLTGEIPIELGNLSKIHALNLSHNHLIGRIPESFSYLHEVESLDLSYNSLNESIPEGLLELHPLAVFSVTYNNLSGRVPDFKGQFGTFDKSSYEGNPFLCGYPLDNECSSTKLSNTSKNESDESDLDYKESFYIGFGVSYGAILLGLAAALCFNPYWRRAWFRLIETLMLASYYFLLDNIISPILNFW
ncbi:cuscuta receptor 1 [Nicotiana tabacum]|uniref:Cuscuta receptor 1 n=1 Tax=Nicotiana tabacum TaxID=4097 RepID=A0AC58UHD7_TOBAC